MSEDKLMDEINLFLNEKHSEMDYNSSVIFMSIVLKLNRECGINDFDGVMTLFSDWHSREFKLWDGDSYTRLNNVQIVIMFITYFTFWDNRDYFKLKYD